MFNFAVHRKMLQLKNGQRLLLRPLTGDDAEKLYGLFNTIPDHEALTLKDDIRDRDLINGWTSEIDFGKVMPLLACMEDRIVGNCTLHFGVGPYKHMGEVRIVLAPEFRGLGLGMVMLKEMEDIARKVGLMFVKSEVVLDQIGLVKAFRRLGYDLRCTFDDYFMYSDDTTHDVTILIKRLVQVDHTF